MRLVKIKTQTKQTYFMEAAANRASMSGSSVHVVDSSSQYNILAMAYLEKKKQLLTGCYSSNIMS